MSAGLVGFWTTATIFVAVVIYISDLLAQRQIARALKDDVIITTSLRQIPVAMVAVALALVIILPMIVIGCDPYLWVVNATNK